MLIVCCILTSRYDDKHVSCTSILLVLHTIPMYPLSHTLLISLLSIIILLSILCHHISSHPPSHLIHHLISCHAVRGTMELKSSILRGITSVYHRVGRSSSSLTMMMMMMHACWMMMMVIPIINDRGWGEAVL